MNRRHFLSTLLAGLATAPLVARVVADYPFTFRKVNEWQPAKLNPEWFSAPHEMTGRRRSLADWLDDLRKESPKIRVVLGSDACEYFGVRFLRGHINSEEVFPDKPSVVFSIENRPYRYDKYGKLAEFYTSENTPLGWTTRMSPEWINAPTEIAIAYYGSTIHTAPFDRTTFLLV